MGSKGQGPASPSPSFPRLSLFTAAPLLDKCWRLKQRQLIGLPRQPQSEAPRILPPLCTAGKTPPLGDARCSQGTLLGKTAGPLRPIKPQQLILTNTGAPPQRGACSATSLGLAPSKARGGGLQRRKQGLRLAQGSSTSSTSGRLGSGVGGHVPSARAMTIYSKGRFTLLRTTKYAPSAS